MGFMPITLRLKGLFWRQNGELTDDDKEWAQNFLLALVGLLAYADNEYGARFGIRDPFGGEAHYHHDDGVEYWDDVEFTVDPQLNRPDPTCDCKVYGAWVIAWLRLNGIKSARPFIKWFQTTGPTGKKGWMYHVIVWISPDDLPLLAQLGLIPWQNTPVGPTLYKSAVDEGWLVDVNRPLGMGWEKLYNRSNKRPRSAEFSAWVSRTFPGHDMYDPFLRDPSGTAIGVHGSTPFLRSSAAELAADTRHVAAGEPMTAAGFNFADVTHAVSNVDWHGVVHTTAQVAPLLTVLPGGALLAPGLMATDAVINPAAPPIQWLQTDQGLIGYWVAFQSNGRSITPDNPLALGWTLDQVVKHAAELKAELGHRGIQQTADAAVNAFLSPAATPPPPAAAVTPPVPTQTPSTTTTTPAAASGWQSWRWGEQAMTPPASYWDTGAAPRPAFHPAAHPAPHPTAAIVTPKNSKSPADHIAPAVLKLAVQKGLARVRNKNTPQYKQAQAALAKGQTQAAYAAMAKSYSPQLAQGFSDAGHPAKPTLKAAYQAHRAAIKAQGKPGAPHPPAPHATHGEPDFWDHSATGAYGTVALTPASYPPAPASPYAPPPYVAPGMPPPIAPTSSNPNQQAATAFYYGTIIPALQAGPPQSDEDAAAQQNGAPLESYYQTATFGQPGTGGPGPQDLQVLELTGRQVQAGVPSLADTGNAPWGWVPSSFDIMNSLGFTYQLIAQGLQPLPINSSLDGSTQSPYAPPGYAQPGYPQPGVDPTTGLPYGQSPYGQPGIDPTTGLPYGQSPYAQPGYGQPPVYVAPPAPSYAPGPTVYVAPPVPQYAPQYIDPTTELPYDPTQYTTDPSQGYFDPSQLDPNADLDPTQFWTSSGQPPSAIGAHHGHHHRGHGGRTLVVDDSEPNYWDPNAAPPPGVQTMPVATSGEGDERIGRATVSQLIDGIRVDKLLHHDGTEVGMHAWLELVGQDENGAAYAYTVAPPPFLYSHARKVIAQLVDAGTLDAGTTATRAELRETAEETIAGFYAKWLRAAKHAPGLVVNVAPARGTPEADHLGLYLIADPELVADSVELVTKAHKGDQDAIDKVKQLVTAARGGNTQALGVVEMIKSIDEKGTQAGSPGVSGEEDEPRGFWDMITR